MVKGSLIKRNNLIFTILLILWLIFNNKLFLSQFVSIKKDFSLIHLSLEEKYKLMDGQFYDFVKFCQEKIPENADVVFIDMSKNVEKHTPEWVKNGYKSGYFRQRLTYYLCPRKTIWVWGNPDSVDENTFRIVFEKTPHGVFFNLYQPGQKYDNVY